MPAPQNVIAVIFDFDDTLTDDSTTKLLESYDIDPADFWGKQVKKLVDDQWDPTLAYLKLILDNVGHDKPFGNLTNKNLRSFGAKLKIYPGVIQLFKSLREEVKKHQLTNPSVEFYVISGGLEEIIKGSKLAPHLNGIWGCRFAAHPEDTGVITHVKNVVSFTEKTKHIFEINKGITAKSRIEPYTVNDDVPSGNRRVPLENMIYVGDGFTDVPCFSLIGKAGGQAFGVFDPKKEGSPKKAWEKLVAPKRVVSLNSPRFGKHDDLGALLLAAVKSICLKIDLKTQTA